MSDPIVIHTRKGEQILVDGDRQDLAALTWYVERITGYARTDRSEGGKTVCTRMHSLIVGEIAAGMVIDHINRNRLDNRRCNLRVCTIAENARNKQEQTNNTSGMRGVYWSKERNRWAAQIKVNGRQIPLGRFPSYAQAVKARTEAEAQHFGSFAPSTEEAPCV